jgi:hypothetical protein
MVERAYINKLGKVLEGATRSNFPMSEKFFFKKKACYTDTHIS